MVIVLFDQEADTPAGRFIAVPIPVAPVVVWVILEGNAALMHTVVVVGDAAPTVFDVVTVIVPLAVSIPQPPVKGIL